MQTLNLRVGVYLAAIVSMVVWLSLAATWAQVEEGEGDSSVNLGSAQWISRQRRRVLVEKGVDDIFGRQHRTLDAPSSSLLIGVEYVRQWM